MGFFASAHAFSLAGLSTEFTTLALAMILGFVHLFTATHFITSERGLMWNMGARDNTAPLQGKLAGRLDRAFQNFKETFVFFAASILALAVLGRHNGLTIWGAEAYLAGRILYLPLYALGVPILRTLVWAVATFGIGLLIAALLGA
ncbi:MAG TPA: MAPEG family protein [Rhizomicrobium sp.]|nr:MAPEG family protein [Rhizomicrobium sp.]